VDIVAGLGWLAAIVLAERLSHRLVPSRAVGWIVAYAGLFIAAVAIGVDAPPSGALRPAVLGGVVLATIGYPLGRALLGDKPDRPPPDRLWLELLALAGFVAVTEELIWGALVEPAIGIFVTAALFAFKHPLVDGRWRRALGLFLFWVGLGLVRVWLWPAALVLHVALNAGGVVLGHRSEADQF